MRNIKFRAYVIKGRDAKMVDLSDSYFNQYFINGLGQLVEVEETEGGCDITVAEAIKEDWSCFRADVMQSSGIKDKNGVEIYEGDIIRSDKESPIGTVVTAKVYWKGAEFALLTTRGSDTTSAYLELLSPFCEVIGNVFEHPHLLKGE